MDLGIGGKIALVTGASTGLGFATARALAAEGVQVAIASRNAKRVRDAATAIGPAALPFVCDLTNEMERRKLVPTVESELGPVDILVVNSGGPPSGPIESHEDHSYAAAVDEHLGTMVALTRAAVPGMRARGWGRIVTITSCAAKQPIIGMVLSNVARAAVIAFARTCAGEIAGDGVTVNNLMPGYTMTGRLSELSRQMSNRDGVSAEAVVNEWIAAIPAGRLGTVEEFAATAAFLCSVPAGYINGTSIAVDGGWNRGLF